MGNRSCDAEVHQTFFSVVLWVFVDSHALVGTGGSTLDVGVSASIRFVLFLLLGKFLA